MKKGKLDAPTIRYTPLVDEGLTDIQVKERLDQGLRNVVKHKNSKSYFSIFADNVFTFFNLLGLIAFIALLSIRAELSNYFFVSFYIANIAIGIVQEIRAKRCVDRLTLMSEKNIKVIRNGQINQIKSSEIVLDDLISLSIGDQIPSDSIIIKGEVEVNEALITGESIPIKKKVGAKLLAGSFIVGGTCQAHAISIGAENYVQQLSAKAKQYKKPNSKIMNSLKLIIKMISFAIVPITIALILKFVYINHKTAAEIVKEATTVVIGMVPAGLMLLTSTALAVGIIKLARQKTLVQDLYSLEMLARVDTICFDKTGTITDGNMTVNKIEYIVEDKSYNDVIANMVSALNDNNQTANAIKTFFGEQTTLTPLKTLSFTSKRKFAAVTFENEGTYAYGAPEYVLPKEEYDLIKDRIEAYANEGSRVLIFAHSNEALKKGFTPTDFTAIGLITISDNVRLDAIDTIKWFKDNDVAIKVISGDNPLTVSQIAQRVGIENADKFISLEGLTDEEVYKCAKEYTVFGRVSPEQKAILIKALKNSGHTTAMTGDGVNDILALREADCAISVASGSDAARSVSHLVLLDNNFNSLPKVVHEGRRVINNVKASASLFLMKTLFTLLMSIITLALFDKYPFRLPHMIMIEMLVIGMPAFFLSFQPNTTRVDDKFIRDVMGKALPGAILMFISVIIIEILEHFLLYKVKPPIYNLEIYTALKVFSFTLAGAINLFLTCRPFTKYRAVLFSVSFTILLAAMTFLAFNGLGEELVPILPNDTYWHLLIIFAIFTIQIPIAILLHFATKSYKLINKDK